MTALGPGILLFAAGLGTRMQPLTLDRPKPLICVAGKPMIDHALDLAQGAGLGCVVVNAHYKAAALQDHLAGRAVRVVHEPTLLDTGGGLKNAAPHLTDPVLTLNTDAIWSGPNPLSALIAGWRPGDGALMLLTRREQGDFAMDGAGRLTRGGPWVFTGAQMLRTGPVLDHPETVFSLNLVWDRLIEQGMLRGMAYDGKWCDVGTPDAIPRAERMLSDG